MRDIWFVNELERRRKIGLQIKSARVLKEWNQDQLAERLGVTQRALSRWERGVVGINSDMIPELANILGKPISFFYEPFDSSAASSLEHEKPDKRGAGARGKPAVPHHRAGKRSAA